MALIRAISLDFDGAIFNDDFHQHKDVIRANKSLLDQIANNAEGYEGTTLYAGTNRQSVSDDRANAYRNKTGSAFPHLIALAAYFKGRHKVKLDRFLLTDLYHQRKAGQSFNEAISLLANEGVDYDEEKIKKGPFKDWLHDQSKLTVLYAQIHRFAKKHSKDTLDFYFYDDRNDILDKLHAYFKQNPHRLPDNLCLHLKRYCGEGSLNDYPPIQGTGKIDKHYKATVKRLAADTLESLQFQKKSPANTKGRPVRTYKEAEESNFVLTATLDCISDCQLLATQPIPAAVTPLAQPMAPDEIALEKSPSWQSFSKPTLENHGSLFLRQIATPLPSQPHSSESSHSHSESSEQASKSLSAGDEASASAVILTTPEEGLKAGKALTPVGEDKKSDAIAWQFYRPTSYPLPEKPMLRQAASAPAILPAPEEKEKQPGQFL
ncbi:hypothetical protein [Legionella erythra]|uniref:Dot/Icm T4SS effector n=1 Tax=Legionella erythra TaxID=448 RepID=A0A0W0TF01_LEGER|nr:hypothetical protein [Legionella erythra]KTC94175.1 Dot/Icm T4SS effector [Legionella erythra]